MNNTVTARSLLYYVTCELLTYLILYDNVVVTKSNQAHLLRGYCDVLMAMLTLMKAVHRLIHVSVHDFY